jgi:purine nucleosidase
MKRKQLVIDTDVGTDVDDLFALAYALKNPSVQVNAISTVIGHTDIRAKIARKLERILRVDVPITAGQTGSEETIKKYWTGIEEQALTQGEMLEEFNSAPFPHYKPDTRLVCIGPLTNIAYQLINNPSIKKVKNVYVMGSSETSHNFRVDLSAKHFIFAQPWRIYQITKEVSKQIAFSREELEQFKGTELGNFLYESAITWLNHTGKQKAIMYDVLAVSSAAGEDFVKFEKTSYPGEAEIYTSCNVDPRLKEKLIKLIQDGI